jgi:hypothetical protein
MEKGPLIRLLEAIDGMGYELLSLNTTRVDTVNLELRAPVFVNNQGEPVNPETGELLEKEQTERFKRLQKILEPPRSQ